MKRLLFLLAPVLCVGSVHGQEQSTPVLSAGVSNTWNVEWPSTNGRTYFLQHSDDLLRWQYLPAIEFGTNQIIGYGFASSSDRFFLRLKYTDEPTADPDGDDFDGDGLSNWAEVGVHGTDPFQWDTNGDGLSDGASVGTGFDPASDDVDGDGITNLEELALGTNPFWHDTDGDGVEDGADVFPFDPTRWSNTPGGGDTTPPTIMLIEPPDAVPLP
mgnify:CR=1 FL=1